MYRILIAEDNKAISNLIKTHLSFAGYDTSQVYDGEFALEILEAEPFDLLILDLMLPKVSGVDILARVKDCQMPIIVVTALDDLSSKVQCLQVGADDYITKPFDSMDLLARVGAVLRRCRRRPMSLNVRNISVDPDQHRVLKDGKEIELTPKEFDLLYYLTRKEILSDVWGYNYVGETRTVDIHIQRLRKKLDWEGAIQTITKVGYLLKGSDDR